MVMIKFKWILQWEVFKNRNRIALKKTNEWECIERHSNDLHAPLEHPQYLKSAPSDIQMLHQHSNALRAVQMLDNFLIFKFPFFNFSKFTLSEPTLNKSGI